MHQYVLKPIGQNRALPDDFGKELNPAQKEAVMHDNGPLLIIAGAGSGKTKTLTYRVARLVHQGVAPEQILLLTFTRKAAQEMLKRAASVLDNRCRNVSGGTFHAFANTTLRRYAPYIGFSENFTILDRGDSEDLIQVVRKQLNLAKTDKRFPQKGTIASVLGKHINVGKPIKEILAEDYPQYAEFAQDIETIGKEYKALKKQMQVLDYDDLLTTLLDLLKENPEVKAEMHKQFLHILVDEYQDTNAIQAALINELKGPNSQLTVVGDDSQSIYSFRGADFRNIMNFPNQFPGTKIVTLEENYRSSQSILDLTNAVISRAREKYSKSLYSQKTEGPKPVYIEAETENMQSRFICQKILELREEGTPLNQIAVLIRSGWHSNDLEVELKAHNIPFVKHGGFKFIEAAHVKDVLAFLRVQYNPADFVSWQRILTLIDGVGPKAAELFYAYIQANITRLNDLDLSPFGKKAYLKELQLLTKTLFSSRTKKPSELIQKVLQYYKPIFQQKYEDYTKRQTDLDSIENISERFEDMESFLTEMSLEPPESSQSGASQSDNEEEKLILSTIHSSKGLEWHSVFLISAVDGFLPSFQSLGNLNQIEEERRLLYVALTRAKKNLYIIKPHLEMNNGQYYRYSGIQFSKVSRFLAEAQILDQFTEKWALTDPTPKPQVQFSTPPQHTDPFQDPVWEDEPPADPNRRKYYF